LQSIHQTSLPNLKLQTLNILIFFSCFTSSLIAQHALSGKVIDDNQQALAYVNLSLYSTEENTFIDGMISDANGEFKFNNLKRNSYKLKLSFMGFVTKELKVDLTEDTILDMVVLEINQARLSEVQLDVKQPDITKKNGILVFTVENTSLSSGNTWNLLKQTPGVINTQDKLLVRSQNVTIYINDQKVYLSASEQKQLLEGYSAENIKAIEVIANPSAKYDAEDGPILNIVTSKILIPTYKGSIYKNYTQSIYAKYQVGTSHYYRTKKFNFFINYSINPAKKLKQDTSYINFQNQEDGVFSRWNTDFDKTTRSNSQNAHIILDYEFNSSNKLSVNSNILYSPNEDISNKVKTNIANANQQIDSTFYTHNNLETDLLNSATNVKYTHIFDKENTELSVNGHLTYYHQDQNQSVLTDYMLPTGTLLNRNAFCTQADQKINIYAAQADFKTQFGEVNFNTGLKVSSIDSNSKLSFFNVNTTASTFDNLQFLDMFDYHETVTAFYAEGSRNWKKFDVNLGVRIEDTHREGVSFSEDQVDQRDYVEVFPNLNLSYKISKNHNLSFVYGRKIARPRYKSLNPFRYFLNENNFRTGNPNLRASISNNFNLNYTFKNAYIFDFYYRNNGENATQLVFQDNDRLFLRSVYANVLESTSYGVDFIHRRSLKKWWYTQVILSLYHEDETFLALESNNTAVTNNINGFYASLYNNFKFTKDKTFSGDFSLLYISSLLQGSYKIEEMLTLSVGLRKTFWKGRAEVSVHFADMLNQQATWLRSDYLNQDNGFFAQPENRYVRLGFTYNFGNFKLNDNKKSIESKERERIN